MTRQELLNIILELDKIGNKISVEEQINNLDWMLEAPKDRMIVFYYGMVKLCYSESEGGLKLINRLKGEITEEYIEEVNRLYKFYNDIVKP